MYSITFDSKSNILEEINSSVEQFCEENGCSFKSTNQILIIIDEMYANLTSHAYSDEQNGNIQFSIDIENEQIVLKFIDEGEHFDPTSAKTPDVTASAEERDIGGLGIFLIKKLSDSVEHARVDNKNVLIIKKSII